MAPAAKDRPDMPARLLIITILLPILATPLPGRSGSSGEAVSRAFRELNHEASWRLVTTIPLGFNAHHPQGMVKIGDDFFLTAVEVTQTTRRYPTPVGRLDRDQGAGLGHLFKFNRRGERLADLRIGEGPIYHPGGIDYDGRHIWIPVAEYRPDSRSIIYRVDPARREGLKAEEFCRFDDHLGGVVHWIEHRSLVALSWGARRLHHLAACLEPDRASEAVTKINPSFYIDYQDCHYLGRGEMICGGLRQYGDHSGGSRLSLGGLELVDLVSSRPIHQLPVAIWTDRGQPLTRNPFWIEPLSSSDPGLRAFFIPEDGEASLLIYEIRPSQREARAQ